MSVSTLLNRFAVAAALAVAGAVLPGTAQAGADIDKAIALFQALDKITGRVSEFSVPVGDTVGFSSLSVTVRACRVTPPEEDPEAAAFMEVDDSPPGEATRRSFTGWMFASSPALSAMEHPVYDVWVVGCADSLPVDLVEGSILPPGTYSLPDNPALPPRRPR